MDTEIRKQGADHVFVAPASRQLTFCGGIIAGALGCWVSILLWPYWPVVSPLARAGGTVLLAVGSALGLAGSTVILGQCLLDLRNLRRPILRIAPGEIEHMPVFRWSPRRIRASDVVAIASSSRSKVVLKTATGRERIVLRWLSRAQRDAARAAIERWVENRDGAEGPTRPDEVS